MSTTTKSLPFSNVEPSLTASRATGYIPPAATASHSGHAASTTTRLHPANPSTPAYINDFQWINSYLFIHKMSTPSYRYSFLLWIFIVLVVLIVAILHWTGSRGGYLGAAWAKWALRRRTWRKKHALAQAKRQGKAHQQPFSFPSNAQMLSLIVLFLVPIVLCVIGPDYIAPGTKLWDLTHNVTKRGLDDVFVQLDLQSRAAQQVASTATTRAPEYTIPKAWWTIGGRTGIIAFSLFPLVVLFSLKAPPFAVFAIPFLIQVHFDKLARLHRWTGRLIWIITTIHVVTWGIQLFRDKRGNSNWEYRDSPAWLFVWQYPLFIEGVIAYVALTALCVLSIDSFRVKYYEAFFVLHLILVPVTLVFAALHFPTIWWWCWSALFLWIAERLYRAIRWAYVNGLMGKGKIPVGAAPPPMKHSMASLLEKKQPVGGRPAEWEYGVRVVPAREGDNGPNATLQPSQRSRLDRNYSDFSYDSANHTFSQDSYQNWEPRTVASRNSSYYGKEEEHPFQPPQSPGSARPLVDRHLSDNASLRYPPTLNGANPSPNQVTRYSRIPPPGFAIAQLLPGRVVRLRLLTPRPITWAPGQHVLLSVPSVSKYTTHPFTISGCYDDESDTGEGRVVELLIRAKNGFTKHLWEEVVRLVNEDDLPSKVSEPFADSREAGDVETGYGVGAGHNKEKATAAKKPNENAGVLIRAFVDGPFGSSIRAHWGNHSSVLIVVGGTGVTFGVSILEYLCLCLAGRDGKSLGGRPGGWGHQGFKTSRVRFIWLVREFSHIQWCATVIRRCMEMVPSSALQVDIFVSNADITTYKSNPNRNSVLTEAGLDELAPPSAQFMRRPRTQSNSSVDSLVSANSALNSMVDVSYMQQSGSSYGGMDYYHSNELGHESHVLDFTNFDGEDDTRVPGEAKMSKRVQKEGKIRRAKSRRVAAAGAAKVDLEARSRHGAAPTGRSDAQMPQIARVAPPSPTNPSAGLPQGAYSPISATQTSPVSYDARYVTSAADQYRSPDAFLSPTDLAAQRRWSAASLSAMRGPSPRPSSPHGHDGHHMNAGNPNRFSVASMGDLGAHAISPSPGPGAESMHRLVMGDRPDSVVESILDSYVRLEIDDQELDDLHVVAEMARPGKPKLERVLADEVGRARGAVAVACCGPASLNALVRKMVAMQINPKQVLHGEMQGMITLITEEFQW